MVDTENAQWSVTAGTLGWFPPGLKHKASVRNSVEGVSYYFSATVSRLFPLNEGIYSADPFVLNLLERISRLSMPDYSEEYKSSLLTLLSTEINHAPRLALNLPLPHDKRARAVADVLLNKPDCSLTQRELALNYGLSTRHLSRLYLQQTGLSFSQWRQQSKVITSLQWLIASMPISEVADRSGYSNVSAYIEAFKKRFGKTPGQF